MKSVFCCAAIAFVAAIPLRAQVINIDFLAKRGTTETATINYVGQGADGGGTVFNGLTADNTATTDKLTVSGFNLKDSNGNVTTAGFTTGLVGSDHAGPGLGILNDGYIFIHSANNSSTSVPFTLSGLTGSTVSLYFYGPTGTNSVFNANITGTGGTVVPYAGTISPFTATDTTELINVPVSSSGTVSGFLSIRSGAAIVGGLSIVEVPEPSTWMMLGLGAAALAVLFRHRVRT